MFLAPTGAQEVALSVPQQRESKLYHDMVMSKNHWRVQIQHFNNLSSSSSLYFYLAFLLKFRNEHVNTMSRYLSWES